jgi:osmotically-inducible protein OsmY
MIALRIRVIKGGPVPKNIKLEDEVRSALDLDPRIAAPGDIAVSAQNGTVTLRGTVSTLGERHAIVEDVKSMDGVDDVENGIQVRLLGDPWDERIRGAALQMLLSDDALSETDIDVKVTNGWVTLTGRVTHQWQSDAAYGDVTGLDGVGGVTNKIRVSTE